jgi:glycosyltransferase involved in cell wall biosynthesis
MTKILMVAPEPFFEPRGTPLSVYQRLRALSALGYQVDLLTYPVGQDVEIPGVAIHRALRVPFIKAVKAGPSWSKAFLDVLLFLQAFLMLSRHRYAVIHSHEEAAFGSVLLSKLFQVRHVYDMHSCLSQQLVCTPGWNLWLFSKLFERLERWVIRTCDVVITIGTDLEERVKVTKPTVKTVLIQNLGFSNDENGTGARLADVLREKLQIGSKLPVVYTGTFERYQGLDLLLQCASIVTERHPETVFILVGGRPDQVDWGRQQAIAYGIQDAIVFTGTVPLAQALAYLEVAEILVSPRTEGMSVPLKLYTYLEAGKPIVATDIWAHSQVLDAETALLVPATAAAFADGILVLAQSPDLRKCLGARAQQVAKERYNPAEYLDRLDRLYRGLLPTAQPGSVPALSPEPDQLPSSR